MVAVHYLSWKVDRKQNASPTPQPATLSHRCSLACHRLFWLSHLAHHAPCRSAQCLSTIQKWDHPHKSILAPVSSGWQELLHTRFLFWFSWELEESNGFWQVPNSLLPVQLPRDEGLSRSNYSCRLVNKVCPEHSRLEPALWANTMGEGYQNTVMYAQIYQPQNKSPCFSCRILHWVFTNARSLKTA